MELETILTAMADAGCADDELVKAKQLYGTAAGEEWLRFLRRCRCGRMEELHESQCRVDCMDYLIRQTIRDSRKEKGDETI